MKIVLDTNVFVSGLFFSGPPSEILRAWRNGTIDLVLCPEILDEYRRVAEDLSSRFEGIDLEPLLELLVVKAQMCSLRPLPAQISADPDDEKFLACALASGTKTIVSGDKHLLNVSGYAGLEVLKPRVFLERYLIAGGVPR